MSESGQNEVTEANARGRWVLPRRMTRSNMSVYGGGAVALIWGIFFLVNVSGSMWLGNIVVSDPYQALMTWALPVALVGYVAAWLQERFAGSREATPLSGNAKTAHTAAKVLIVVVGGFLACALGVLLLIAIAAGM